MPRLNSSSSHPSLGSASTPALSVLLAQQAQFDLFGIRRPSTSGTPSTVSRQSTTTQSGAGTVDEAERRIRKRRIEAERNTAKGLLRTGSIEGYTDGSMPMMANAKASSVALSNKAARLAQRRKGARMNKRREEEKSNHEVAFDDDDGDLDDEFINEHPSLASTMVANNNGTIGHYVGNQSYNSTSSPSSYPAHAKANITPPPPAQSVFDAPGSTGRPGASRVSSTGSSGGGARMVRSASAATVGSSSLASGSPILAASFPDESFSGRAFRSLPSGASSSFTSFYAEAPLRSTAQAHIHSYPDGSKVEDCMCLRGQKLVKAEQDAGRIKQQPLPLPSKDGLNNGGIESVQPQTQSLPPPSQLAHAELSGYTRQMRPADSSRQHSLYAASFPVRKSHGVASIMGMQSTSSASGSTGAGGSAGGSAEDPLSKQSQSAASKARTDYFASGNKSYVRTCMQDPGFGFNLDVLQVATENQRRAKAFAKTYSRGMGAQESSSNGIQPYSAEPERTPAKIPGGTSVKAMSAPQLRGPVSVHVPLENMMPYNFAMEISREHMESGGGDEFDANGVKSLDPFSPSQTSHTSHAYHAPLRTSTAQHDYSPPDPEALKSYTRVGTNYRQAGNKSYIRYNLVDQEMLSRGANATAGGNDAGNIAQLYPPASTQTGAPRVSNAVSSHGAARVTSQESAFSSALPSNQIHVPFTATTTHHLAYLDHTRHLPILAQQKIAKIVFGNETGPKENVWQRWDDNMATRR